jgi:Meckel syndrome type 1 protein
MTMSPPMTEREDSPEGELPDGARAYRGRSLGELLPRIRAELGPDAVVLRQREGRAGGIGGFFAQRYYEVLATAGESGGEPHDTGGGPHGEPATAWPRARQEAYGAPRAEEIRARRATPAIAQARGPVIEEATFASLLAAVEEPPAPAAAPSPLVDELVADEPAALLEDAAPVTAEPQPATGPAPARIPEPVSDPAIVPERASAEPAAPSGDVELAIRDALLERGVSDALAARLIAQARAHQLPFAPAGDLRDAVRGELARALPEYRGLPTSGALVALVGAGGAGKTRVAAALATAYHAHSDLTARAITAADTTTLTSLLAPHGIPVSPAATTPTGAPEQRDGELVVLDTPAVSPATPNAIAALRDTLASRAPDAILVTLPATTALRPAGQLLTALAPLTPTAIVITHADETDQLGAAVETAINTHTPLAYIHDATDPTNTLRAAHPTHIAGALLP